MAGMLSSAWGAVAGMLSSASVVTTRVRGPGSWPATMAWLAVVVVDNNNTMRCNVAGACTH